jgi:acetyl-CoA C-acetyltransferase
VPFDARAPVLVGVGQVVRHDPDPAAASEPLDLMLTAARRAADDAVGDGRGDGLLARLDSIRVSRVLSWNYVNPGLALAERLGVRVRETVHTSTGGNSPQLLVNDTAAAIRRGDVDVVLIAGAEAMATRQRARRRVEKVWLEWPVQGADTPPAVAAGDERPGSNDAEMARSLALPTQIYPVLEHAVRAAAGRSVAEHVNVIAGLWSRFSAVAATNPYAWSPTALGADAIATVTPDNRCISSPYTKLLNANLWVDQAAALLLCSAETARAAGVPRERWVYPLAGAEAHDHWWVSERADLHSSPAIRIAGRAALAHAGVGIDDIAHVDLYSCFPSAVEIGAAALGLSLDDPDRPLTVTGGLTFAGGPGNNYAAHSIATMVERLRGRPGTLGLVTALGWYVTKHSIGVYGTEPGPEPFAVAHPQAEVDALPRRAWVAEHDGPVTVESFTVMHDRDAGPVLGIVACLLPDGRRAWGNVREPAALAAMTVDDPLGRPAKLHGDGTLDLG